MEPEMQTLPALLPRSFPPSPPVAPGDYPRPRSGFFARITPANEVTDEAPPSAIRVARPPVDPSADDVALVHAAAAGDARAHVAIWRKYTALVRSKMGRSVGGQDVDDLVQEVFLRLFEFLPHLRDPAALRSFIIGITLRVAGTELRRRRCRWWLTLTATGELPEPTHRGDDGSDAREVLSRLLAVLAKLSPHSSRVFELRFIEDKELADVATAMNISLATAKRHLSRASSRVRAMAEREPVLAGFIHGGPIRKAS
jgi:RNA polymerase sigma-70 factor (ECF subfamily)